MKPTSRQPRSSTRMKTKFGRRLFRAVRQPGSPMRKAAAAEPAPAVLRKSRRFTGLGSPAKTNVVDEPGRADEDGQDDEDLASDLGDRLERFRVDRLDVIDAG